MAITGTLNTSQPMKKAFEVHEEGWGRILCARSIRITRKEEVSMRIAMLNTLGTTVDMRMRGSPSDLGLLSPMAWTGLTDAFGRRCAGAADRLLSDGRT